jgi:YD repeat-containing protein
MARWTRPTLTVLCLVLLAAPAHAQTTYHLHKEPSSVSSAWQLAAANPEPPTTAVQSIDLKSLNPTAVVLQYFETQSGVPNTVGTIPAGATVSASFWMKKTASWGTMFPQARLSLNTYDGTLLCTATGATAVTTTLAKYAISCTVAADVTLIASDRFYLAAGVNMTVGPGNHSVKAELDIEGTVSGNYDSTIGTPAVVPPPPRLTGLSPTAGAVGTSVSITGQYFGSVQGTSTVKFGTTIATPSAWSDTTITVPVPAGATTGQVLVTVAGQNSNTLAFMVSSTGTIAGTITRNSDGSALSGATVDVLQAGSVKATATSDATGHYATSTLISGFYALRVSAAGFVSETRTSLAVGGGAATNVSVAMTIAGTITGQVTASGGGAIAGAAVTVTTAGGGVAITTADAAGAYAVAVKPGTYSVDASAPGFAQATQNGVSVADGGAVTVNLVLGAQAPTTIQYVYDELGRLVGVVDATGDTATYAYDAVGNVLSIGRHQSSQISIVDFTPNFGPVGTAVIIAGTGFSATPSENTVAFNGTSATVTAATATQLTVTVPSGATTGTIAVTSPAGSATSGSAFAVGIAAGAPTITGFSPAVAAPGTALTINGSNFQTTASANTVSLNVTAAAVTSATASTISTTVPPSARSGHVKVATALGNATSSGTLFIPPSPYTAAQVGSTQTLAFDTPTMISTAPNTISLAVFDGVANQRVMLEFRNYTGACSVDLNLYDRWIWYVTGSGTYNPTGFSTSGGDGSIPTYIDTRVLPYTGTYQIVIDACDTATSSTSVNVHNVPADVVSTIAANAQPVSVGPLALGQNARLTFNGTQAQRVSLIVASTDFNGCGLHTWILNPAAEWAFDNLSGSCIGFMEPVTLPSTGPYTLFADPNTAATGSFSATLYNVDPDLTGTLTVNGQSVNVTTTAPGQNARYTFTLASTQQITVHVTGNTMNGGTGYYWGYATVRLLDPNGTELTNTWSRDASFNLSPQTLPAGTYTVVVDPYEANWGTLYINVTNP